MLFRSKPLNQLTKVNVSWSWTPDGPEQSAFDELKQLITSTPILVLSDQTKHFQLKMDTSAYATGAVLSQLCDDGCYTLCNPILELHSLLSLIPFSFSKTLALYPLLFYSSF